MSIDPLMFSVRSGSPASSICRPSRGQLTGLCPVTGCQRWTKLRVHTLRAGDGVSNWTQPVTLSEYREHRLVCFQSPSCWCVLISREREVPSLIEGPEREAVLAQARAAIDQGRSQELRKLTPASGRRS
jgi:hypothetical protein